MELFAYRIRFDEKDLPDNNGKAPRLNFDTMISSILTQFSIVSSEDWIEILFNINRSLKSWIPGIYLIIIVIMGNFILVNMLLAILIYHFAHTTNKFKEERALKNH